MSNVILQRFARSRVEPLWYEHELTECSTGLVGLTRVWRFSRPTFNHEIGGVVRRDFLLLDTWRDDREVNDGWFQGLRTDLIGN